MFDLRLENFKTDKRPSRNNQPSLRAYKSSWELTENYIAAVVSNERVPRIWPAASNTNVDLFLKRYERRNPTLTLRTVLPSHDHPNAHLETSLRIRPRNASTSR